MTSRLQIKTVFVGKGWNGLEPETAVMPHTETRTLEELRNHGRPMKGFRLIPDGYAVEGYLQTVQEVTLVQQ